ncbi:sigma-70 family RNA polymerase sigma factor [Mucilaginibacter koreensis]
MRFKAPVSEQQIISECKKGSLKHQELLYKQFYGFATGVCLRYSLSEDDALEAVNDAFIKVFNAIHLYNESNPFKAWLRSIVVNTAIDRRRKEMKYHLQAEINDALPVIEPEYISSHLNAQDILKMMDTLPPLHRTVFNLYEIDGYSHDEIGQMLDLPASSSRVYLSRAKEKLKKVIKSESAKHG